METNRSGKDDRTIDQLREHYEIEKELAERLRSAPLEQRKSLYSEVYEELFKKVPHHPGLTRKISPEKRIEAAKAQVRMMEKFINARMTFLEFGAGDGILSLLMAEKVKQVLAVDVSATITKNETTPDNFSLIIGDCSNLDIPGESIDIAYSNQLLEHLHPEDAINHLASVYKMLVPGGAYICITPNQLTGPHDISKYFDNESKGFHLKEYKLMELKKLFAEAGFKRVYNLVGKGNHFLRFSLAPGICLEKLLGIISPGSRQEWARSKVIRSMIEDIRIMGVK